jgi:serine/threonine protein kinase
MSDPLDTIVTPPSVAPRREPAALAPGSRIRQYEIIRELGRGGMGRVYLARDNKLGRRVAMKFLAGGSAEDERRSLEEARATAGCVHENIVVIHEADEDQGRPYIVLEYLEGATLRSLITNQRLPWGRAVELMVPVVGALARAHEFGIVHRDLKPENVFVTSAGTVKVLDFGLAKGLGGGPRPGRAGARPVEVTHESGAVGTLPYMAPEQFWQDELDGRTDLWAVGVMLFEMLAGKHPLAPVTPQKLLGAAAQLDTPMPPLGEAVSDVPDRLATAVERCLKKRKEQRWPGARELLDEIEPLLPRRHGRALGEDESPYPGLTAFQESDADRFFGRAADVARLRAQLEERALVAVAGPSGIGKSSLVRAGLVPALKASGDPWTTIALRPGRTPLQSLARLLHDDEAQVAQTAARLVNEPGYLGMVLRGRSKKRNERLLLFVDQFEELYTLVGDAAERRAFTSCLSGAADDVSSPLRVLLSMRSDFLDRAGEDQRFQDDLTRGLVFLAPLARPSLEEALVQPVEQLGYRLESAEIVGEMLDALASTPGALPLLQFAASKLWDGRDRSRKVLTRASWEAMGGITGALSTHADQVLDALSPSAQKLARAVFTRLVTPDGTRAIVDLRDLMEMGDAAQVRALVDQLVSARLLVVQGRGEAEGPALELIHESLITGWPALRRWLEESREDSAFIAQLQAAAKQWDQKGRPQGLLWRGEAMEEARLWRARYKGQSLFGREAEFLSAVFALANRAARLRRIAVAGTIGFLLLVVGVGAVMLMSVRRAERRAVDEAGRATREAERARAAEKQVSDQLAVIQAEEKAKERAEAEVAQGKEDLKTANLRLRKALSTAEGESHRAQDAAASLRVANTKLEKLLAEERARRAKLEHERKKITNDLR